MIMKKSFFIAALMAATLNANAQYEPGTFSMQIKVGLTGSQFTNAKDITLGTLQNSFDNLKGLPLDANNIALEKDATGHGLMGIDFGYQAAKWLGFSVGVDASRVGTGWDGHKFKENGMKYKIRDPRVELTYLHLPVMAHFYVYKGLAVNGGVQFGLLTGAYLKTTYTADGNKQFMSANFERKVKSDYENFEVSVPVGISYESTGHVVFDLHYNFGLTKVNKVANPDGKDYKNNVLCFTIGYKYKL